MKKKASLLVLATLLAASCAVGCNQTDGADGGNGGGEEPSATYTVTFNSDGGTAVPSQEVAHGEMAEKPRDPIKITHTVDYVFLGWYLGDEEWDFSVDAVTENITLVAKYSDRNQSTDLYT